MKYGYAKMGGKQNLSVFLKGNEDLADSLLAIGEGGQKLARGLRQRVSEAYEGRFDVKTFHERSGPSELLLAPSLSSSLEHRSLADSEGNPSLMALASPTRLFQVASDIVVFSLEPEITGLVPVERFRQEFPQLVADIKERLAAHVIVFNCFTFDPDDHTCNYHGAQDTQALRALKLNLALIDISTEEGISIVDVDRILAELGGASNVTEAFRYSPQACELIRDEFLRILQDIGFFERRPLLVQTGRKGV